MPRETFVQAPSSDNISNSSTSEFRTYIKLTNREREVLQLTAKGLLRKEIAEILHISLRTVNHHLDNLGFKLGSYSALKSVLIGIDQGIIDRSAILKDLALDTSSLEELTPREKDLLESMAESRTQSRRLNGETLSIQPVTVKSYSSRIRKKLRIENPLPNIIPAVLLWMEAKKQGKV